MSDARGRALDLLARTFQGYIDSSEPDSLRTAEFTVDGAAYYRITPSQYAQLMSVAPADIRKLNTEQETTAR